MVAKGRRSGLFYFATAIWVGERHIRLASKVISNNRISLTAGNISSLVIDSLCDRFRGRDIAVTGLYCDHLAQEEQSTTNMLGAILNQLLERGGAPDPIRQVFREGKRALGGWSVRHPDLMKLLKTTITSLPEVFICIGALDECLPSSRRELLKSQREIVLAAPATRVLVTGRPHIRYRISRCFTEVIIIAVIPTAGDTSR